MLKFATRRLLWMTVTAFLVSVASFWIIQLPPGDFLTTLVAAAQAQGDMLDRSQLQSLADRYGLGDPFWVQYWRWISGILFRGDFGHSFEWNRPVSELIWNRIGLTLALSFVSLAFTWVVALAVGVYSAVKQYSIGDYFFTFLGFIGLATPNFVLALVLLYVSFRYFGQTVGGVFSPQYIGAPWSVAKFLDMLSHLWIPIVIIATAGTASLIRVMRANLLDELHKPYTITARAKGLAERKLILKYPVRVALNPFISTVGWALPAALSGEIIVSVVLNIPTTGPLLLRSLISQDMYLAGSFILMLGILTIIGTLISDILLAWLDPRIRYQ